MISVNRKSDIFRKICHFLEGLSCENLSVTRPDQPVHSSCTMLFSRFGCFVKTSLMVPSIAKPSIRRRNCSVVSSLASSGVRGHWKRFPAKSLFVKRSIPSPSNKRPLIAVRTAAAEQEQCSFLCCVQAIVQADKCRESLDPLTEIDPATANDDTLETGSILKHRGSPAALFRGWSPVWSHSHKSDRIRPGS